MDVRHNYVKSFFFPHHSWVAPLTTAFDAFVNDIAQATTIKAAAGWHEINYYKWWDQHYFAQDEWRIGIQR